MIRKPYKSLNPTKINNHTVQYYCSLENFYLELFCYQKYLRENIWGFQFPRKYFVIKIASSLIAIVMLIIKLSFLVGLITKQEQPKGLATDGCTINANYLADEWRCWQTI